MPSPPASTFTPWFKLIAESFLYKWWDALLATKPAGAARVDAKDLRGQVELSKAELSEIIRM